MSNRPAGIMQAEVAPFRSCGEGGRSTIKALSPSQSRPVPRRGLSRTEAAMYLGISPSKFDELVDDGRMPRPRMIDCRKVGLSSLIERSARGAGLPAKCVTHGLRKARMRRLAERGATTKEIASVSGHKTLKEVERYTEAADQARLARAAMAREEQNGTGECLT
jgi:integrase